MWVGGQVDRLYYVYLGTDIYLCGYYSNTKVLQSTLSMILCSSIPIVTERPALNNTNNPFTT